MAKKNYYLEKFKKIKKKIENKRSSENKFWRFLILVKDLAWILSNSINNLMRKYFGLETDGGFLYRKRNRAEIENEWREYSAKEKKDKISIIICVYKRKKYLKEQLKAILNQSIKPAEIFILQNENHINLSKHKRKYKNIKIIKSSENTLYLRWAISYICKGNYIAVFDDDCIPGKRWLENCLRVCNK